MQKPYIFTFIIAYRHRTDRLMNLRKVLEWIMGFNGVEIIVIEQDKSPKLPTFSLRGFKYIFTKSDLPFNKSWAFNVGLKNATTEAIVFGDSDIIMDPNAFISSLKLLEIYDVVSPYNRVIDLNQNEVGMTLDQMNMIDRVGRGETDIQKICLAGGIIMFRKEAIYRIGGWDQGFISWGAEDDYVSFKIKLLLNWFENPGKCYHIWHEKVKPEMALYNRNLQLLNKLVNLSVEDTRKYIGNSVPKIGTKNLYFDK